MYFVLKRLLDILVSLLLILLLSPVLILISLVILSGSGFPVFYFQERVGKNWETFKIIKFRTMVNRADQKGPQISSEDDNRITGIGFFLRKYKIDELPQLFNVLLGEMSLIGPRPEIYKYASVYKEDYTTILTFKPGITDYASIHFRNEAALLNGIAESETYYLNNILPIKISFNKKYLKEASFFTDLKIIFATIISIFK